MSELNDEKLRELLKEAISPAADAELKHDLWPRMLRKLNDRPAHIFWLDWVLIALLAVWCIVFPGVIPALAYHL